MAKEDLTHKQEEFARFVAEGNTYADAYKKAYNASKMKITTIYVKSSELVSDGKISVRISEIKKEIKDQEKVTLDEAIIKLSKRINQDIREMFNEDGSFKNIKELTKEQAMFISSFEVHEIWGSVEGPDGKNHKEQIGELKKVKIESIKDMLDMIIKVHGGYIKEPSVSVVDNLDKIRDILKDIKNM